MYFFSPSLSLFLSSSMFFFLYLSSFLHVLLSLSSFSFLLHVVLSFQNFSPWKISLHLLIQLIPSQSRLLLFTTGSRNREKKSGRRRNIFYGLISYLFSLFPSIELKKMEREREREIERERERDRERERNKERKKWCGSGTWKSYIHFSWSLILIPLLSLSLFLSPWLLSLSLCLFPLLSFFLSFFNFFSTGFQWDES